MELKMALIKQIISIILIISLACGLTMADKVTMERIRKHQEWLNQRNQGLNNILATSKPKTAIESINLWRYDKKQSSINEVYPENDNLLTIEATTSIDTATTTPKSSLSRTLPRTTLITTTTSPTTITSTIMNPTVTAFINPLNAKSSTTTAGLSNDVLETTTPLPTTKTTMATTSTTTRKPKPRLFPRWGNWDDWSECSRSCGSGVRFQQRKCINRNSSTGKLYLSKNCIGVYKRYQLCNEEPCSPTTNDFRAEQCSTYNNVDFQGQHYKWEPYTKDDAECELNCKPVGMKYFATLNASVIDGTPCKRPAEFYRSNYQGRSMCIDGICKAIHTSGVITGLSANSGSVTCGGLLCRPITGLFTRDPLPDDAYVHVATIPAGASNISITELKNSINLLVLRTDKDSYIFNGDNSVSESAAYEAAGAIFDYHRLDGITEHGDGVTEWVTCIGPIRENVELMIYSKTLNPGIKFEYLLPITSDSEENEVSVESEGFLKSANEESSISTGHTKRRRFNWKVVGFSTCSKSCGGGTQTPIIRCVRENPVRYYSQRRCTHAEKPMINENLLRCNTQPCPAYWRLDDWSECRCQNGEGSKERELSCVQELASGIVIHVDSLACLEEKPVVKKACDCPKNHRRSHQRYRMHGFSSNTSYSTIRQSREKAGTWLLSEWNQFCSSECGTGIEYRTIYCDRTKPNTDRCDFRSTPEITRTCERAETCDVGDWFTGPWSPCNGNCFNLTRTRQVLCIQNQLITEDDDCKVDLKPSNAEKCSHEEVEYCGARWHYSEWTECTKTCDTGTQRRTVKCLEYDDHENALRESNKCRYSIREPIYRSCNTHKCEDYPYERLQNDGAASSCVDEIANCQWGVKANLCIYKYYQHKCCFTCHIAG